MGRKHAYRIKSAPGKTVRGTRSRRTGPGTDDLTVQLEQLCEKVDRQQRVMAEQQETIVEQQAEIAALRQRLDNALSPGATSSNAPHGQGLDLKYRSRARATSRRLLLANAGVAAATVAVIASESRVAHAASRTDGSALTVGQSNTTSAQTALVVNSGATPSSGTYGASTLVVDAQQAGADTASISGYAAGTGNGVYGKSPSGMGVQGESLYGPGVFGGSYASDGIYGSSDQGTGVYGFCQNGFGVAGYSYVAADVAASGSGRIFQALQSSAGVPTTGTHIAGEQMRDSNGELWLCLVSSSGPGSPGTWVRAAHIPSGYIGGATVYLPKPIRLLDTRGNDSNAQQNGGGPYIPGTPHTLQIAGVNWQSVTVPSNAVGAIGKVTVISGAGGSGYIALVPSGSGSPTTGTLPYSASQIVATSFNVGLGGSPGALDIYVGGTAIDVVIDLFGVVA